MHSVPRIMKEIAGLTFSDLLKFEEDKHLLAVVAAREILFARFAAGPEASIRNEHQTRKNAKQDH